MYSHLSWRKRALAILVVSLYIVNKDIDDAFWAWLRPLGWRSAICLMMSSLLRGIRVDMD
jgi:hypothetical protein